MCLLCAPSADRALARRGHVLQLLALVEHPDALPAALALRVAQEVLALSRAEGASFRCEAVPAGTGAGNSSERLSHDGHDPHGGHGPRGAGAGASRPV